MATIKKRSISSYSVIYHYKREDDGKDAVQWETYQTELEAMHRKAHIDYLQKIKDNDAMARLAKEYKQLRAELVKKEKPSLPEEPPHSGDKILSVDKPQPEDNTKKTTAEFFEKWLPVHAGKKLLSPFTYDSIKGNLKTHILPYFGDRIMSTITSEDVDEFLESLAAKKCRGAKSFNRLPEDIPTLASGSVKKIYDVLSSGFLVAKEWGYIIENPVTKAPSVRYKKRKFWVREQVQYAMEHIDDALLHLAVHIAFMCSMRAGETMGLDVRSINFKDRSYG